MTATDRLPVSGRHTTSGAQVRAREVSFSYADTPALRSAHLAVAPGESLALMGPSGSGKSTLLHCLAGILAPEAGEVWLGDVRVDELSERHRSRLRLERMGVVFQHGDLVPELTLAENVALPAQLLGRRSAARTGAMEMLAALGVDAVAHRRAGEVSGGQAQRAAVARALAHRPDVVLADEPTGSLDTANGDAVMQALTAQVAELGSVLIVVTHDHRVASHLDRHVSMVDGRTTEGA
ncbi:ABC transporter ATP-binding protein [Ornithinimicrobium murale]|uniref:ABC transporter ATP-binding protein n=1 Tax=Ornithinimicrobium murale TaxID=1050153 RepID=UPI001EDCC45F|nr:ATP-binding cassette domain-containing protein [Ornithinimicrobium murale]